MNGMKAKMNGYITEMVTSFPVQLAALQMTGTCRIKIRAHLKFI